MTLRLSLPAIIQMMTLSNASNSGIFSWFIHCAVWEVRGNEYSAFAQYADLLAIITTPALKAKMAGAHERVICSNEDFRVSQRGVAIRK